MILYYGSYRKYYIVANEYLSEVVACAPKRVPKRRRPRLLGCPYKGSHPAPDARGEAPDIVPSILRSMKSVVTARRAVCILFDSPDVPMWRNA